MPLNYYARNQRRRERVGKKCIDCGKIISPEATRCQICAANKTNVEKRGRCKYRPKVPVKKKQKNHIWS